MLAKGKRDEMSNLHYPRQPPYPPNICQHRASAEKIEASPARWLMDNGTIVKIGQNSSESSPATHHSM